MSQFPRGQLPEAVAGPNAVLPQRICSIKGRDAEQFHKLNGERQK